MDPASWGATAFGAVVILYYAYVFWTVDKRIKAEHNYHWWRERVEDPRSLSEGFLAEQMVEFYENELRDKGIVMRR